MSFGVKHVVIGGGVVGLAIGARLARFGPTIVLEKAKAFGEGTSSRNSEVIHAGLYYPPQSLKTKLCIRGRSLLYKRCAALDIGHKNIGKWIIAINKGEADYLNSIKLKADDLKVPVHFASKKECDEEPNVVAHEVLVSTSTGIVDSHQLMVSFITELESLGGNLALNTEVKSIKKTAAGYVVQTGPEEFEIETEAVINCAGLHASHVARMVIPDLPDNYKTYYCKGQYFAYEGRPLVKRLVYPVPEKNLQGLGVHVTIDLAGRMKFGPDAFYIKEEEDYSIIGDEKKKESFCVAISKYIAHFDREKLYADYTGIRPKLSAPGEPARDFLIEEESKRGLPGFVNLLGIESPGLTSSLAIAEDVSKLLNYPDVLESV